MAKKMSQADKFRKLGKELEAKSKVARKKFPKSPKKQADFIKKQGKFQLKSVKVQGGTLDIFSTKGSKKPPAVVFRGASGKTRVIRKKRTARFLLSKRR